MKHLLKKGEYYHCKHSRPSTVEHATPPPHPPEPPPPLNPESVPDWIVLTLRQPSTNPFRVSVGRQW